jgi:hypothetical protein
MKRALVVSLGLLACTPVGAGELIFSNGSRLAGDLSNEALMVSTGSGLIEIASEEVVALSREEIQLRDGRVIRGTLVGGQVKARTSLGEIAVKVDELQSYRGNAQAGESGRSTASSSAGPATPPATPVGGTAVRSETGITGGLPTLAAYQEASSGRQASRPSLVGAQTAALPPGSPVPSPSRVFEVLGESVLYRDALYGSARVGRVASGQQVSYVDAIDRRLRILNLLVFDGGHWVRIRLSDGTEGWVPADLVREVR